MEALIGIIGVLLGAFFYQRNKANTAEARNENIDTKEKVNNLNKDVIKNDALNEAEEQKRNNLVKENEDAKAIKQTIDTLSDFFNKR